MSKECLNFSLTGYGGFNPQVGNAVKKFGHEINVIVSPSRRNSVKDIPDDTDVIVDSAQPKGIIDRIQIYAKKKALVIVATTGWDFEANRKEIETLYRNSPGAILISPILSTEVYERYAQAMELAEEFARYDSSQCTVHIHEQCPDTKTDIPSGTALLLAKGMQDVMPGKAEINCGKPGMRLKNNAINITSIRQARNFYLHRVDFRAHDEAENITEKSVEHRATSRVHIAEGIVQIAEAMVKKRVRGVLTIKDLPNLLE